MERLQLHTSLRNRCTPKLFNTWISIHTCLKNIFIYVKHNSNMSSIKICNNQFLHTACLTEDDKEKILGFLFWYDRKIQLKNRLLILSKNTTRYSLRKSRNLVLEGKELVFKTLLISQTVCLALITVWTNNWGEPTTCHSFLKHARSSNYVYSLERNQETWHRIPEFSFCKASYAIISFFH